MPEQQPLRESMRPEGVPRISEGVLLAFAPIAGYALTFLFEIGYVGHFGIPADFIELSITDVFTATAFVGVVILWVVHVDWGSGSPRLWGMGVPPPRTATEVRNAKFAPFLLFTVVLVGIAVVFQEFLVLRLLVVVALAAAYFLIWPQVRYRLLPRLRGRHEEGFSAEEAYRRQEEREARREGLGAALSQLVRTGFYLPLSALFILGVAALLIGGIRARHTDEFLVPAGQPHLVVVRVYGSTVIAVRVDREGKTIGRSVAVLRPEGGALTLVREKIGRLRQAGDE